MALGWGKGSNSKGSQHDEDILVIGQVGHSLDILDVGMLHKKQTDN